MKPVSLNLFLTILAALALSAQTPGKTSQTGLVPTKTVLFVCEHGAAKSVLATAEFNRLAEQRGLPWRATARGTNPDSAIPPAIANSLDKDGMKPEGTPRLVAEADVRAAAYTITLGATLPNAIAIGNIRDWNVPSPSADLAVARQDIRRRVAELLADLSGQPNKGLRFRHSLRTHRSWVPVCCKKDSRSCKIVVSALHAVVCSVCGFRCSIWFGGCRRV